MAYPKFLRRRGFGVHSPFAFRFVTEVISERSRYYDYKLLPARQHLLYRLAAWLQPTEISVWGDAEAQAARLAAPERDTKRVPTSWAEVNQAKLAVVKWPDMALIQKLLSDGWVVYAQLKRPMVSQMKEGALDGLAFVLHHRLEAIIFPWSHLPRQIIDL